MCLLYNTALYYISTMNDDSLAIAAAAPTNVRAYKRERKHTAQVLPQGLTHAMMKKYVVYYRETFETKNGKPHTREYFKVEAHPKLTERSVKPWIGTKSGKVTLIEKLNDANQIVVDLEADIYPSSHYILNTGDEIMKVNHDISTSSHDVKTDSILIIRKQISNWTKLMPKYVSIRALRLVHSDSSTLVCFVIIFDKKDTENLFRWTVSHQFKRPMNIIMNPSNANNIDDISLEIDKLRDKLNNKYGIDLLNMMNN
jgi:hypothetical protein